MRAVIGVGPADLDGHEVEGDEIDFEGDDPGAEQDVEDDVAAAEDEFAEDVAEKRAGVDVENGLDDADEGGIPVEAAHVGAVEDVDVVGDGGVDGQEAGREGDGFGLRFEGGADHPDEGDDHENCTGAEDDVVEQEAPTQTLEIGCAAAERLRIDLTGDANKVLVSHALLQKKTRLYKGYDSVGFESSS